MQLISNLGHSGEYEVAFVVPEFGVGVLYVQHFLEHGDYVSTAYAVRLHGRPGKGRFTARFPGVGEISGSFTPKGGRRVGKNERGCKGPPPVYEEGFVRGTITLRGARHYFHVRRHIAEATLQRSSRLECPKGHAAYEEVKAGSPPRDYVAPSFSIFSSSGTTTSALLWVEARTEGRFIGLRAAQRQGLNPSTELQIGVLEGNRRMAIAHSAVAYGGAGTFLTSLPGEHPGYATLAPSAPFHGQAEMLENSPRSHAWSGSLGISFPGYDIPLTGHGYYTSLCVISPVKIPQGCDFIKVEPFVPERASRSLARSR